jgi:lysozyme
MEPINREVLEAELVIDEGEVLNRSYIDTEGHPSAGVGRNLDSARKGPKGTRGISARETLELDITRASVLKNGVTRKQSRALLANDLDNVFADLDRALPWWRTLDPVRQRVLANMCFNLGITKLLGFKQALGLIKRGLYDMASETMLESKWARQVGKRALRLSRLMLLGPAQR